MLKRVGKCGEGAYSKVYTAKHLNGKVVATKINLALRETSFSFALRELDLLMYFKPHPQVAKLTEVYLGSPILPLSPVNHKEDRHDNIHFIFDKASYDLAKEIHEENVKYDPAMIESTIAQMCLAIHAIHKAGVTHRDIKPHNFLVYHNNPDNRRMRTIQICDFGLAKSMVSSMVNTPRLMTCWYRAPEIILDQNYNQSADIWSLGCTIYELIVRDSLIYCEDSRSELEIKLYEQIKVSPETREPVWLKKFRSSAAQIPRLHVPNCVDLVSRMLKLDPKERLTIEQILAHPFFSVNGRQFINSTIKNFPIKAKYGHELTVNIESIPERKWACEALLRFITLIPESEVQKFGRKIFLGLDIFDRYLDSIRKTAAAVTTMITDLVQAKVIGEADQERGRFLSRTETIFNFLCCFYVAYKYHFILDINIETFESFHKKFLPQQKFDITVLARAEAFENDLITQHLNFYIYNNNIFDTYANSKVDAKQQDSTQVGIMIKQMLQFLPNWSHPASTGELTYEAFVKYQATRKMTSP
jgi:serine/threonine protein kinase